MSLVTDRPLRCTGRRALAVQIAAIALLAWTVPAKAADPSSPSGPSVVFIDPVVPFANAADDDHDPDCPWNADLPRYLAKESEGRILISTDGDDRPRLKLATQTLHFVGGGGWSGPKWLVIEGQLTDHGKLIGSFEARRQTVRGSLRGCKTIHELGEAVADDILEWLDAPTLGAKLGDAK